MQAVRQDGTFGEVLPFSPEGLKEILSHGDTDHVDVFQATKEEVKKRGMRYTPKKKKRKNR